MMDPRTVSNTSRPKLTGILFSDVAILASLLVYLPRLTR
jgi:hypothetical protein